jgi:hypothetical protein
MAIPNAIKGAIGTRNLPASSGYAPQKTRWLVLDNVKPCPLEFTHVNPLRSDLQV